MSYLHIRIEEDTKEMFNEVAKELGLSLSAWVRMELVRRAKEMKKDEKKDR